MQQEKSKSNGLPHPPKVSPVDAPKMPPSERDYCLVSSSRQLAATSILMIQL